MKKLLLTCAAALMAVGSAWAEFINIHTLDFEDANTYTNGWTVLSGSNTKSQIEKGTGKAILFQADSKGSRDCYYSFSGISNNFTTAHKWKIEFDYNEGAANTDATHFYLYESASGNSYGQFTSINKLFDITDGASYSETSKLYAANTTENELVSFPTWMYVNNRSKNKVNTTINTWYHVVVVGDYDNNAVTVSMKNPDGTDLLAATKVCDFQNPKGMCVRAGKGLGEVTLDDVKFYVDMDNLPDPEGSITAVNGTNRTISFANASNDPIKYYITDNTFDIDGKEALDYSAPIEISATSYFVVYADNGLITSNNVQMSFEAGTNVALATPTFRVTALTENASGAYYPTIDATCNNSAVLLNPAANVTATFNGDPVSLPYVATQDGSLVVTATCDGYTSSENTYNVTSLVKAVLADYTNVSEIGAPAAGMRKWSGNDHWALEEGVGIKAVRDGGNSWFQINRAGMVAYDEVLEDKSTTTTYIDVANDNTGNNSLKYVNKGKYVAKLYYFTEGKAAKIAIAPACTDGEKCYSTYSNSSAWVVPADLTVSEVGVESGALRVVSYNTGDVVPANTGVMVSAAEGGDYVVILSDGVGTHPAGVTNLLRPSGADGITAAAMAEADADCTYYRLTMHNGETIGFWWGAAEGAAFNLAANKAYLAVPKSAGAPAQVWFEESQTAISLTPSLSEGEGACYDLFGRKSNGKGLMIQNGKVVLVK